MYATDWIQAISSAIIALISIPGVIIGVKQLFHIKEQLMGNILTNVLNIEAEMNDRKEKVDDLTNEISMLEHKGKVNEALSQIYSDQIEQAVENWLNSVDRLCFCIRKEYLKEKDWKTEYRDYVLNIVAANETKFGPGSKYISILDINNKWRRG